MTRVLQIGLSFEYGGIESFVMNYYRCIDRSLVQFDFVNPYSLPLAYENEMIDLGAKIYSISDFHKNPYKYRKELKNILKIYEVVHIHMLSAANILPLQLAKECKLKKIIVHSHNTLAEGFIRTFLHKLNYNRIKNIATDLLSCSVKAGEWMFGRNTFFNVINNAIDVDKYQFNEESRHKYRSILGLPDNAILFGNIGRLNVQKNQLFLIDIFKEICKINTKSYLCIIGDGEMKTIIQKKIYKENLSSRVIMLGRREDVDKLYNAFDAIIMPSLFEGLPITLVEAQANGLKCFVSKDCIPEETKILDSMVFIELNKNEIFWAKQILDCNYERIPKANSILSRESYNINIEVKKIQQIYTK